MCQPWSGAWTGFEPVHGFDAGAIGLLGANAVELIAASDRNGHDDLLSGSRHRLDRVPGPGGQAAAAFHYVADAALCLHAKPEVASLDRGRRERGGLNYSILDRRAKT